MVWLAGVNHGNTDARCHGNPRSQVDASITHSQRKPKSKPSYEVVNDREDRDDEAEPSGHARE